MHHTSTPDRQARPARHLPPGTWALGTGLLVTSSTVGFTLTLLALIILVALCIYGLRHVRHLSRGE